MRSEELHPGGRLGPYELVAHLGAGGMGEVWRARDPRLDREVAVKVLPVALSRDAEHLARLEREARALAALTHPNIVTIHSVEEADGIRFLTMELIEGDTLDRLIPSAGMALDRFLELASALADALAAAHARGVLHRDLKPRNLMVTREGRVKVLDFGLARRVKQTATHDGDVPTRTLEQLTRDGTIVGTAPYMSPEQAQGRPLDARSDLFSLGAVLYEMATGQRPFRGDSPLDVLSSVLRDEPASATDIRPDLPPALSRMLRRCLAKDPERRFQSAKDLRNDLEDLRAELSAGGTAPRAGHPTGRAGISRRRLMIAAGAVLTLLFVLTGGRLFDPANLRTERDRPSAAVRGPTIAVLPFQHLGLQPADEHLGDAIAEDLHHALSQVAALRVISLPTSMRYRGTNRALSVIGEELNAGTVLDGSVRRAGDAVRVALRLIDVRTDQTLWAGLYDLPVDGIFRGQGDVVRHVTTTLDLSLTPQEAERIDVPPTDNPAAYRFFHMARQRWTDMRREVLDATIELYSTAIEHDPRFALAYAELAFAYAWRFDSEAEALAWEMTEHALELDSTLAFAHFVRGTLLYGRKGRFNEGRSAFHRSIAYDPNAYFSMHNLSLLEYHAGRYDESLRWARQGLEVAPDEANSFYHVSLPLIALGDDEVTERFLRIGLDKEVFVGPFTTFGVSKPFPRIPRMLSRLELFRGNDQQALAWVEGALELRPEDADLLRQYAAVLTVIGGANADETIERLHEDGHASAAQFAMVLLRRGERERAQSVLQDALDAAGRWLEERPEHPQGPVTIAGLHAVAGNVGEALAWLEKAYDMGHRDGRWLDRDPVWDNLRAQTRFTNLVERMHADVARMRAGVDLSGLPGNSPD
jgi:eukaryotic-like serine/threonine-protein kinase